MAQMAGTVLVVLLAALLPSDFLMAWPEKGSSRDRHDLLSSVDAVSRYIGHRIAVLGQCTAVSLRNNNKLLAQDYANSASSYDKKNAALQRKMDLILAADAIRSHTPMAWYVDRYTEFASEETIKTTRMVQSDPVRFEQSCLSRRPLRDDPNSDVRSALPLQVRGIDNFRKNVSGSQAENAWLDEYLKAIEKKFTASYPSAAAILGPGPVKRDSIERRSGHQ